MAAYKAAKKQKPQIQIVTNEPERRRDLQIKSVKPLTPRDLGEGCVCFNVKEVAELLGVSGTLIHGWIYDGKLLAFNAGRGKQKARWRIPEQCLKDFITARVSEDSPYYHHRRQQGRYYYPR